ncbi:hypothetical protein NX059_008006 [Plenodomus lindquistii]|nr:hypothetical protein NX059_008006 [Plenodomus lindquistii]
MRKLPTSKSFVSALGSGTNHHGEVFADVTKQARPEQASTLRNRGLWAHALVIFNVYGTPLSFGPFFEYYFNTLLPTKSPSSLAIPVALQIVCILGTPSLAGYAYHKLGKEREWWRLVFIAAGVVATVAQLLLQWCKQYLLILILQGPVLGSALGTLWTISTLVLASHYKANVPLVNMCCGFAGFTGAAVYTAVARWALVAPASEKKGWAQTISGCVMFGALLIAYLLMQRVKEDVLKGWTRHYQLRLKLPSRFPRDLRRPSTMLFFFGYTAIFFSIFIHPIYIVLILTQPPTSKPPERGTVTWLVSLGCAACVACLSAHAQVRRRTGVVNLFACSAMLAGATVLAPIRTSQAYINLSIAVIHGGTLGALFPLHIMVAAMFLASEVQEGKPWREDVPARVALVMAIAGMCAFVGIITASALIENLDHGVDIALRMAGAGLMSGGMLVATARFVKWRKFWYAV